ncbi:GntR family transcriptional regulator [Metabacillus sp. HB246100]|uniref:GntR family transcriptional regulator n=1 Tax=Bacillus weihaiensis TaxID=1547283 RepID=UPI002357C705|nr:GntR family transcriptional regulator [Bacillus weihaiensis]
MNLNGDATKPIYIQIAEWLETEILKGNHQPDGKMYSQYQLAEMFTINPATAAKGLSLLVEDGILYKRRGLGMFVSHNAEQILLTKRKEQTLVKLIEDVVQEANRLRVSEEELIKLIQLSNRKSKGDV